jgi:hypothetical protein
MSEIDLGTDLIVGNLRDDNDDECRIWLDKEDAREVARRLINLDAIFEYSPDDGIVEIGCSAKELAKCVKIYIEVRK